MITISAMINLTFILRVASAETESLLTGATCTFPTYRGYFDCFDIVNPDKLQKYANTEDGAGFDTMEWTLAAEKEIKTIFYANREERST